MTRQPYYVQWSCGHRYYGAMTNLYPRAGDKVPKKCIYCGKGYVKTIALTNLGNRVSHEIRRTKT